MNIEQALEQIEIAYAALTALKQADWLHQVHSRTLTDLNDAIHYTNEVWARLEDYSPVSLDNPLLDKPLTKSNWQSLKSVNEPTIQALSCRSKG